MNYHLPDFPPPENMEVEEVVEVGEDTFPQSKKIRLVVAPDAEG